jgi:hypothetical protein
MRNPQIYKIVYAGYEPEIEKNYIFRQHVQQILSPSKFYMKAPTIFDRAFLGVF